MTKKYSVSWKISGKLLATILKKIMTITCFLGDNFLSNLVDNFEVNCFFGEQDFVFISTMRSF